MMAKQTDTVERREIHRHHNGKIINLKRNTARNDERNKGTT